MEDQIPREVMDERLQRLQARITEHSSPSTARRSARDTQILIDRKGRLPGQMIGKSPWLQSVHVETDAAIGDMLDVTLVAAGPNSMAGADAPEGGRLMARRDLAAVRRQGAPGSSWSSSSLICSGRCSATTTAT